MHSHHLKNLLDTVAMPLIDEPICLQALRRASRNDLETALYQMRPDVERVIAAWAPSVSVASQADISLDVYSPSLIASTNGCWPQQLPFIPGVSLFPLSSLKDPYTTALHASWQRFSAHDGDLLSFLARSLYHDALFIDIPPNTIVKNPLHILHLLEPHAVSYHAMPRLHISVGKNASFQVIESSASSGFLNTHLTVDIEEGGSLIYTRLDITPSPATCSSLRAAVQKNASLTATFAVSAPLSRHTVSVVLAEQGASTALKGLSVLPSHHHSFFKLFIDHRAEQTSSCQLFKGLVTDKSLGSFESNVVIRKEAGQSHSHQHSHFLTLGSMAQTYNKPSFDIFTDDVIAAHGATSGAIDQEELFYLTSRGLAISEARRCLIEGFCEEIVCALPEAAADTILDTMRGVS